MKKVINSLQYLFAKKKVFTPGRQLHLSDFELKGWDLDNYHIPAMNCAAEAGGRIGLFVGKAPLDIMRRPQQPLLTPKDEYDYWKRPFFIPDYVKEEIAKSNQPGRVFTHYAGSLITKTEFRPPFHLQVTFDVPYVNGLLPCPLWLYHCKTKTEEFDLAETDKKGIWFAYNYSALPNWGQPRYCDGTHILWAPQGKHTIDFELDSTTAKWYLDGKLIKTRSGDFDLPYFLLSTMIVTKPTCPETQMIIHQMSIEQ